MDYTNRQLYHITHINNLQGILDSSGLVCKNDIDENKYTNIAYDLLQERRAGTKIPIAPFGTLHDYAPFFFCKKPPMLYTISRNNVVEAENAQNSIIYFVTTIDRVLQTDKKVVFTDGHAIMALTNFYNDVKYFDKIDWELMDNWYWADTEEDNDRKRRKQAEFLIYKKSPIELFNTIVCQNRNIFNIVTQTIEKNQKNIEVEIKPDWYYQEM